MLSNLLSNACKYTPVGGHVEIGAAERDGRVYTTVTNSGPGIATDKLPHIFERFFTGHTYDRYSSGVGLSYVKSLVELHDGAIGVESRENEYTRFTFWLPVRAGVSEVHPVDIARYNPEIFDESRLTPEIETETDDPAYLEMGAPDRRAGRRRMPPTCATWSSRRSAEGSAWRVSPMRNRHWR